MSIRLTWHIEGWNGHICKKPCENAYCIGRHTNLGDLFSKLSSFFVRSNLKQLLQIFFVTGIYHSSMKSFASPQMVPRLPDFTVKFRVEAYYWEHVGLTHDAAYSAHWTKKQNWYQKHFP